MSSIEILGRRSLELGRGMKTIAGDINTASQDLKSELSMICRAHLPLEKIQLPARISNYTPYFESTAALLLDPSNVPQLGRKGEGEWKALAENYTHRISENLTNQILYSGSFIETQSDLASRIFEGLQDIKRSAKGSYSLLFSTESDMLFSRTKDIMKVQRRGDRYFMKTETLILDEKYDENLREYTERSRIYEFNVPGTLFSEFRDAFALQKLVLVDSGEYLELEELDFAECTRDWMGRAWVEDVQFLPETAWSESHSQYLQGNRLSLTGESGRHTEG